MPHDSWENSDFLSITRWAEPSCWSILHIQSQFKLEIIVHLSFGPLSDLLIPSNHPTRRNPIRSQFENFDSWIMNGKRNDWRLHLSNCVTAWKQWPPGVQFAKDKPSEMVMFCADIEWIKWNKRQKKNTKIMSIWAIAPSSNSTANFIIFRLIRNCLKVRQSNSSRRPDSMQSDNDTTLAWARTRGKTARLRIFRFFLWFLLEKRRTANVTWAGHQIKLNVK